jgi:hypothetical protein
VPDDPKVQMNRIRRKIAGTKPKNSDGTTFHENLTGKKRKGPHDSDEYHGHHKKKD